jgi:hypothetical protein
VPAAGDPQPRPQADSARSQIGGQFTDIGQWVPIHYIYRHMEQTDLLAWYRQVTPWDRMNLVAKNFRLPPGRTAPGCSAGSPAPRTGSEIDDPG